MVSVRRALCSLAMVLALTACAAHEPRALTNEESERLASVLVNNALTGSRSFTASVPGGDGGQRVQGTMDFRNGRGYAEIDAIEGVTLVLWDGSTVGFQDAPEPQLPEQIPASGWTWQPLKADVSPVATTLVMLVSLGTTTADNPLLIRQNGARWLGEETIDNTEVDIFSGPTAPSTGASGSAVRYWVTADGTLERVVAQIGTSDHNIQIDLGDPVTFDIPSATEVSDVG